MKKLVLVKFGGSLITDKTREETANLVAIDTLSRQLKGAVDKKKDTSYLLGTGAGSFGHIQVEKYHLKKGAKTASQKLGFARVEDSVARLNRIVVSSLLKHDLPAISVNPSSIFVLSGAKVKKIFLEALIGFLKIGMIPLVYGDMAYDKTKGASVLSTDRQFLDLAVWLKKNGVVIDKVIFCGITPGVVDKTGKTIKTITRQTFPAIKSVFFDNSYVDVTGGMKKKVEIALEIARKGIKSYIIKGNSLNDCLFDNKFEGTVIE